MAADGQKLRIKRLIIDDPAITVDEILEELSTRKAPLPSRLTVTFIRADFRQSLKLLRDEGFLTRTLKGRVNRS